MSECCDDMEYHIINRCKLHTWSECGDVVIHKFINRTGEVWYGIPIHDGGSSAIAISFCPWCGKYVDGKQEEAPTDQP